MGLEFCKCLVLWVCDFIVSCFNRSMPRSDFGFVSVWFCLLMVLWVCDFTVSCFYIDQCLDRFWFL